MGPILVIKLSALGDLVQVSGTIRDIREHHPDEHITIMTMPRYQRLMEKCPWVDDVLLDPRASRLNIPEMLKLRKRIRAGNFQRVYDLQQKSRTRFYYRFLFPHDVEWCGDIKGGLVYLKQDKVKTSAPERLARFLRLANIEVKHTLNNDVSWMADPVEDILSAVGLNGDYIVLIPGASAVHPEKRWPYFKELATRLEAQGYQVVTVPGPDELDLCKSIPGIMLVPGEGYYDYFKLAGILKNASYVVGNDTGPTQIAANLGCRGLALYSGFLAPERTGIQFSKLSWLQSEDLADLDVDDVYEQVINAV